MDADLVMGGKFKFQVQDSDLEYLSLLLFYFSIVLLLPYCDALLLLSITSICEKCNGVCQSVNVCYAEKRTKRSSILLMLLVRFSA